MMATNIRKARSEISELQEKVGHLEGDKPSDIVTEKRFASSRKTVTGNFELLYRAVDSHAAIIQSLAGTLPGAEGSVVVNDNG